MSTRAKIGVTAAAVAIFLASWFLIHHAWYRPSGESSDVKIYQRYAQETIDGKIPYRSFSIEYPPGFLLPALGPDATADPGSYGSYAHTFDLWMGGAGVALILLTAVALGALRVEPWHFAGALGSSRGGALFGAAIATKLWPAVFVPLCLVWIARRRGRREALRWLAIVTVTCAAFFLPFAALSPGGIGHSFGLQLDRPLQIESLGSGLLLAAHNLFGLTVKVKTTYGSQNLVSHGATAAAGLSAVLQILALCGILVAFARGQARADRLVAAAAASVAVFIAFGKVFSPQYLIWLIPFVPLVRSRLATLLFGVSLVLTLFYFPDNYASLVSLESHWATVVLARDIVVLVVAVELVRVLLAREPAEAPAVAPVHPAPEAVPALP